MTNKPIVALQYEEPQFASEPEINRLEDMTGLFRRVSSAPTWTPRGRLIDSLAFYASGITYRLYVYDYTNKAWRYTALT